MVYVQVNWEIGDVSPEALAAHLLPAQSRPETVSSPREPISQPSSKHGPAPILSDILLAGTNFTN